jgi:hypothetical protein
LKQGPGLRRRPSHCGNEIGSPAIVIARIGIAASAARISYALYIILVILAGASMIWLGLAWLALRDVQFW